MDRRAGTFRLLRQAAGRTGFAEVRVKIGWDRAGQPGVVWGVDPLDDTSVQPERDPELARAAVEGAIIGLRAIAAMGFDVASTTVHLTWIGMNVVDTEATAVRAAACAATADAFGLLNRFEVSGDAQGWRCEPTRQ
ncbi:hypothetical protein FBZ33_0574 [Micromonospora sp. A202]|uniref:hypothetical protein n=1 Tax=Micromonospora sp. A202 TaxID=2572899 RepID=UPI00114E3086|nr:hypothetical protein [Micromonospora sp. A202]TQJ20378.1 hypothetical protein FBZ33_0574 [Micromonospora sp. A202]